MCESLNRDYQLCSEIGRGRFGVVYRCYSTTSGDSFACKSIDKRLLSDDTDRECLDKEPKILQLLRNHPNILHLHNTYEDDNYLHIVTDLCDSADLYHRLTAAHTFSEPEAASIFKPLISAISHCHRLGIAHRDIKPDNVLFDSRNNKLKLADFGSAEWFGCGGERRLMGGIVGTPYYVAPEVLSGREYTEKVDVWSAAVILYIMLTGVPPFFGETATETFEAVLRGNLRFPTKYFRSVSPEAKDLLRKMLCKDASRRLSAEQVLRKLKLNVDASLYPGTGGAGIGGIIRNDQGEHVLSFSGKSGDSMVLHAEIYALFKGLTIVHANNLKNIEVESDSLDAVRMVNFQDEFNSLRYNLIPDIRRLLTLTESEFHHIPREKNKCADLLARIGSFQVQDLLLYNSPREDIIEALVKDREGDNA